MSREPFDHQRTIERFAGRVVNLHRDNARKYRQQVWGLRDRLDAHLADHPDFELKKMLLSGSLAKHTALRTINDADVALYAVSSPHTVGDLLPWIADRLPTVYPNIKSDQVQLQTYSVRLDFRGTGLSVDIVPVYAEDTTSDWGQLVSQDDGQRLRTNIALHKAFIQTRRKRTTHYTQIVRLLKWWVRHRKTQDSVFRLKSFMVELILATLCDRGVSFADYPEALISFFDYIAATGLSETISFTDFADAGLARSSSDPIRIFDPVNGENNVARTYTETDRTTIVDACIDAGDAIDAALRAPTKGETLAYWRSVFGPSFG
ncbi:MAG: CBASS oligonucleotide cyclase [Bryobacterales bacterium]|nr:CBASS oligonucleotide cyclase [Bryobacterales bacterium]